MGKIFLDEDEVVLWSDCRRIWFISWPFEKYTLTNKRLFIERGIIKYSCDEIKLFRVNDTTLSKGLIERLFGYGTITIISTDKTTPKVTIGSIVNSEKCRQILSESVEKIKKDMKVFYNQS